jgi:ribosomal protein L11 methyltransferase
MALVLSPGRWTELTIIHPPETTEAVHHFLFELGATGVASEAVEGRADLAAARAGFDPAPPPDAEKRLDAFFSDLVHFFNLAGRPRAVWRTVDVEDWAEKWKEGLKPLPVGDRLLIRPSWFKDPEASNRLVIEIDPGMAFGTGGHATTFLCLTLLERHLTPTRDGARVLDLGCGSGILAMAAARLGAGSITAVDNDPEAVTVAQQNLAQNRLTDQVTLLCGGPEMLAGPYDLTLANLTAGTIMELAPELARLTETGGRLILSGILTDQCPAVTDALAQVDLEVVDQADREEWSALTAVR